MDIVDEGVPPPDGQGGQVMSADQCERCGRYLYSSRESETSEERDLLLAEVEALRVNDGRYRWLRSPKRSHAIVGPIRDNTGKTSSIYEYRLDRDIDAEMAASSGGEEG